MHASRQDVAQAARDDAGACRRLQHTLGTAGGDAPGDVGGIVDEDHRPQALIIGLRDAADETRCAAVHAGSSGFRRNIARDIDRAKRKFTARPECRVGAA
jgi:hypothetical protein